MHQGNNSTSLLSSPVIVIIVGCTDLGTSHLGTSYLGTSYCYYVGAIYLEVLFKEGVRYNSALCFT